MEKIEFIIFDEEDLTKTLIETYLKELSYSFDVNKYNEFDENLLSQSGNYKIIVVNISRMDSQILSKISELSKNKKNYFVVISNDNSTDLRVKSLRSGAKDFLLKPLQKSEFLFSVQTINKIIVTNSSKNSKNGFVFTSMSTEESVGKTTFLVNLAKELADSSGEKVLLIDFNNTTNDISFLLNLDIRYNTAHYINNINEQNIESLLPTISKYKDSSLYVMANGFLRNKETKTDLKKIPEVLNLLKQHFRYILIDSDIFDAYLNEVLTYNSDITFFITLPSGSMFTKVRNYLDVSKAPKKVKIVLNRYEKKYENKLETFVSIVRKQIYCKIPQNYIAVGMAHTKTTTLKEISSDFDIVKTYVGLSKHIISRSML